MSRDMKKPRFHNGITGLFKWWAWQGLNLRPLRCQHYPFIDKSQKTGVSIKPSVRTQSEHRPIRRYSWDSIGTVPHPTRGAS